MKCFFTLISLCIIVASFAIENKYNIEITEINNSYSVKIDLLDYSIENKNIDNTKYSEVNIGSQIKTSILNEPVLPYINFSLILNENPETIIETKINKTEDGRECYQYGNSFKEAQHKSRTSKLEYPGG